MNLSVAVAIFCLSLAVGTPAASALGEPAEKPRRPTLVTYSGVAQIDVDYQTGRAKRVTMAKSTGSEVCDDAAI